MSTWRIGTLVCSNCGTVLSIKSTSDRTSCYLCDTPLDLSDLPIVEQADEKSKSFEQISDE